MTTRENSTTIPDGYDPAAAMGLADGWLTESIELGLGANDPDNKEIVEVNPR